MLLPSQTIARLIEPTLSAFSKPSVTGIATVLDQARASVRDTREALKQRGENVHDLSLELGAGQAFVEMLATMRQRSVLGDAIRAAEASRGTEILHLIASLQASDVTLTQGELADSLRIDRGNFNRYVRRLVEAGLLESQRANRQIIHKLSDLGLDVLDHLRPGWKALDPRTGQLIHSRDPVSHHGESVNGFLEVVECFSKSGATSDYAYLKRTARLQSGLSLGYPKRHFSPPEFHMGVA